MCIYVLTPFPSSSLRLTAIASTVLRIAGASSGWSKSSPKTPDGDLCHASDESTQGVVSQLGHSLHRQRSVCAALPCGMARQDQRSRRPTTRRTLLPAVGCLATAAPGSAAGFVGGGQEAQAVETTTPHSGDRSDPGRHFDRSDADASSLPHQAATVELQRAGIRNA